VFPPKNNFGSPLSTFDNEEYHGDPDQDWFYSFASFAGILGIQTCIDHDHEDEGVVGMLLHFSNRKEVLGQWRFDLDRSKIIEMPTRIFLWQYRFASMRRPCVNIVVDNTASFEIMDAKRVQLPDADILDGMEEVGMHKAIVWWFGNYGNVIEVKS
jgi:hypothetical protein